MTVIGQGPMAWGARIGPQGEGVRRGTARFIGHALVRFVPLHGRLRPPSSPKRALDKYFGERSACSGARAMSFGSATT